MSITIKGKSHETTELIVYHAEGGILDNFEFPDINSKNVISAAYNGTHFVLKFRKGWGASFKCPSINVGDPKAFGDGIAFKWNLDVDEGWAGPEPEVEEWALQIASESFETEFSEPLFAKFKINWEQLTGSVPALDDDGDQVPLDQLAVSVGNRVCLAHDNWARQYTQSETPREPSWVQISPGEAVPVNPSALCRFQWIEAWLESFFNFNGNPQLVNKQTREWDGRVMGGGVGKQAWQKHVEVGRCWVQFRRIFLHGHCCYIDTHQGLIVLGYETVKYLDAFMPHFLEFWLKPARGHAWTQHSRYLLRGVFTLADCVDGRQAYEFCGSIFVGYEEGQGEEYRDELRKRIISDICKRAS